MTDANTTAKENHKFLIHTLSENAALLKKIHNLSLTNVATSTASPMRSSGLKRPTSAKATAEDEGEEPASKKQARGDIDEESENTVEEESGAEDTTGEVEMMEETEGEQEETASAPTSTRCNEVIKATAYFDCSALKNVALSTILVEWNVKQLDRDRFLGRTKFKSNITKLKKLVKYTRRWVDEKTKTLLTSTGPNQTENPDAYWAWRQSLKDAAAEAEKQVMAKLALLESAHPAPQKPQKPNAKAKPIGKKQKKAAEPTQFVYALETRLSRLINRKIVS